MQTRQATMLGSKIGDDVGKPYRSVAIGSQMLRCAQHDRLDLAVGEERSRSFEPRLRLTGQ